MSSTRRPRTTRKGKTMLTSYIVYTSLNGSSVLRYWPVTHVTYSHCRPIWPADQLSALLAIAILADASLWRHC